MFHRSLARWHNTHTSVHGPPNTHDTIWFGNEQDKHGPSSPWLLRHPASSVESHQLRRGALRFICTLAVKVRLCALCACVWLAHHGKSTLGFYENSRYSDWQLAEPTAEYESQPQANININSSSSNSTPNPRIELHMTWQQKLPSVI